VKANLIKNKIKQEIRLIDKNCNNEKIRNKKYKINLTIIKKLIKNTLVKVITIKK